MTDFQELNRLRWRCRRGMRELDALLMRFVDGLYTSASPAEQAGFQHLLSLPDPEILALLAGQAPGDDPDVNRVIQQILEQPVS